ncbi:MAG TPA: tetratricopeptide repeat protein, partial [Myxococcota bacterium]|nr:tetratricopeptide repeat protein [Myxococcota bacterium]
MLRLTSLVTRTFLTLLPLLAALGCARDPVGEIRSLQDAGRYQESLEPLEKLLQERSGDAEVQYLYGIANVQTGRFSQAVWPLRKASENPEWAVRAGEALAKASLAAGDEETAIEAATHVLEKQSDDREMLKLRAEAQLRQNRFD